MKITNDLSYVNMDLINRGLMRLVPYSIRIDRYFTDEQKESNRTYAETHTNEEWNVRCENIRKEIANTVFNLMEHLKTVIKFGQYEQNYEDDFDLWFWCNDLYQTTNGKLSGRDYSYITLSFMNKENYKHNEQVYEHMRNLLAEYPADNIQAHFQYSQIEIPEKLEQEAERIFNECVNKFVTYKGYLTGRLEKNNGKYFFKKKNAKKYGYILTSLAVCTSIK